MGHRRGEEMELPIHKIWGASREMAGLNVRSKPAGYATSQTLIRKCNHKKFGKGVVS